MDINLTRRLKEVGLTREEILKVVNAGENPVVVYTTHMDGLGVRYSDFDVYVLTEKMEYVKDAVKRRNHYVKMITFDSEYYGVGDIPYLYLDVEYWDYEELNKIIEKVVNRKEFVVDEIKLLYRLRAGECINSNMPIELVTKIKEIQLDKYVADKYADYGDQALHDCISLYQNKDYYGTLLCGRQAINYAITGLNAKNGKINLNIEKWSSRIFILANGYGKYLDKYKKFLFDNLLRDDAESNLYNLIIFVQDILNYELGFLGKTHWLNKSRYKMWEES